MSEQRGAWTVGAVASRSRGRPRRRVDGAHRASWIPASGRVARETPRAAFGVDAANRTAGGATTAAGADGGTAGDAATTAGVESGDMAGVVARLDAAVREAAALNLDGLSDEGVRSLLRSIRRPLDRLSALRTRLAGELEHRAVEAVDTSTEKRQAEQDTRRLLRDELGLPPGDARRMVDTGRRLRDAPEAEQAHAAGELSDRHAAVITDTLKHVPWDEREQAERRLLTWAKQMDPVALGRHARRLLAELDLESAERAERRRHRRRTARVAQTPDGGVAFSGVLYGLQGERLLTAVHAFRQPDDPLGQGETRTPEQATADAFDQLFDAALRSGRAPTDHGVRPHVTITVSAEDLARQAGLAELPFTGTVTLAEVRHLLADCSMARLVLGPDSVPLEVSKQVRTVPAGLWRALAARDQGCTWHGCDAPAGWCDVAHGEDPYRRHGKLKLSNAALLCRRHHRQYDHPDGGWTMTIHGASVTYQREPGINAHGDGGTPAGTRAGSDPNANGVPKGADQLRGTSTEPPPGRVRGRPPDERDQPSPHAPSLPLDAGPPVSGARPP